MPKIRKDQNLKNKKSSTSDQEPTLVFAPATPDHTLIAEVIREWIVPALVKRYLAERPDRNVVEKS